MTSNGDLLVLKTVDEKCLSGHSSNLATFSSNGDRGTLLGRGVRPTHRGHSPRVMEKVIRNQAKALACLE